MFDDIDQKKEKDKIAQKKGGQTGSIDSRIQSVNRNSEIIGNERPVNPAKEKNEIKNQEFNQRIENLRTRGRKRGRRYSIIGISISIIIFCTVMAGGYYLLMEVFALTSTDSEASVKYPIEDPEGRCNDDCCLSSLLRIRSGHFQEIANQENCPEGYIKNQLKCATSFSWCELDKEYMVNAAGEGESIEKPGDQTSASSEEICIENCDVVNHQDASSTEEIENIDLDNDGLLDEEELIYGTDPKNFDTDGDGYSDGGEVKNGYNPLGGGRLVN